MVGLDDDNNKSYAATNNNDDVIFRHPVLPVLAVDLDHTLVHASSAIPTKEELSSRREKASKEMDVFRIDISPNEPKYFWVKVRPGARAFLAKLCRLNFILLAYTQGVMTYARQILRILDPRGAIFGERLIAAQDNSGERLIKSFEDAASSVGVSPDRLLVIDDRVDVWKDLNNESYRLRLIRVKPYVWFQGKPGSEAVQRVKQLSGLPTKTIAGTKFDDSDFAYLKRIGEIVVDIWHRSLLGLDNGLLDAARVVRRGIFAGRVLVFDHFGSPKSEVYVETVDAGAVVRLKVDDTTYCVVTAGTKESDLTCAALKAGKPVVSVKWLLECLNRWELIDGTAYTPPFARPEDLNDAADFTPSLRGRKKKPRLT